MTGLVKNPQLGIIPASCSGFDKSGVMMKQVIAFFILGLVVSTGVSAGTYKWVDKDGNVVYSQHPPAEGQYEAIRVKPEPRNTPAPAGKGKEGSQHFLEKANSQRKDDAKLKAELKKTQELRKKNCETAKKQLEFYTVYRRKKDQSGEYVRITDAEKDAGLKEAKQAIKDFCD